MSLKKKFWMFKLLWLDINYCLLLDRRFWYNVEWKNECKEDLEYNDKLYVFDWCLIIKVIILDFLYKIFIEG